MIVSDHKEALIVLIGITKGLEYSEIVSDMKVTGRLKTGKEALF